MEFREIENSGIEINIDGSIVRRIKDGHIYTINLSQAGYFRLCSNVTNLKTHSVHKLVYGI